MIGVLAAVLSLSTPVPPTISSKITAAVAELAAASSTSRCSLSSLGERLRADGISLPEGVALSECVQSNAELRLTGPPSNRKVGLAVATTEAALVDLEICRGAEWLVGFSGSTFTRVLARLREVEQEAVGTRDVLCQLLDAINPSRRDGAATATSFTLPDLRRCQQCGLVANTLCNLHKFLAIESHDAQAERDKHAMPHLTEWDRWAKAEYARLAEDEGEDQASIDELEGLEDFDEHEFRMWSGRNMGSSGALESPF